ncbi:CBS domain-containing protein [Streptomyces sp. TLI_146]|uniref:CBS domain-containing protein n=1 Tax=Streptomyces sp. TLI_146 TaxID=1938858 RepID=UPI000C6FE8A5|nr:CBS domain-containing protein [Streptomyces sp. TLI_146]PKV83133.1 BON domain-containing protein [Streptomyces sp. TLI_146]
MARIIGEVMTREVVEAHPETPFKDLVRLLDRHRISGLPVVDEDDKVVGVISETDLIHHQAVRSTDLPARRFRLAPPRRRSARRTAARTAQELMSTPAVTVHPEQRITDAARVMERHGVERLPVVDEEDRLIGIATRRDLLRVFLRTDDEIRQEILDAVATHALGLPTHEVNVSVRDGMVTLQGSVEQRADIPSAIRLAYRVDGVVGVVNGLNVHPAPGPLGPSAGPTEPGGGHH